MPKGQPAGFEKLERLQSIRLIELLAISEQGVRDTLKFVRSQKRIPRLGDHFRKHGWEFEGLGITSASEYEAKYRGHLANPDLRVFTYITTKATADRMWILVNVDTGIIAQYNESKRRVWSFYVQPNFAKYLNKARGWWLEVLVFDEELRVERWK